jgi:hypothetical protein
MKSTRHLSVIAAALVLSVSFADGQGRPDPSARAGEIANWPAPPYWSPPAQPVSGQDREGGIKRDAVESLSTSPFPFIGITPCRIVDTRTTTMPNFPAGYGPPALTGGAPRDFALTGQCGIAGAAGAVSLNITVTNTGGPGFILIYPQGGAQPTVSTLNYVAGQTVANAAVVPLGTGGGVTVIAGVSGTDLILDTNGYYAGAGVGIHNTFLGLNAGNFTMTGDENTGLGHGALSSNTTGDHNTATGNNALGTNNIGVFNTASGTGALGSNTSGQRNTATGTGALGTNVLGNFNTATGSTALLNTTGSSNIGIGFGAGSSLTTGSNDICIGNSGVAGESGTIRIGDVQTVTFLAGVNGTGVTGVPVLVSGTGQLGVASSSRLVKEDIREIAEESDGLMRLRPVAFKYKPQIDPAGLAQYGLIAEEVADVYPDLVAYDRDGRPDTVRYHLVNALLLNEVQKQHRTADSQEKTIEQQKGTIDRQQAEIEELKARLSRLEARLLADPRP